MRTSMGWDRVFSTASWIVVFALIFAAISVWFAAPSGTGPMAGLLGIMGAQIFYSILYGIEAVLLGFSKWRKHGRMRKNVLLVIYLTGFFTSLLTILLVGWSPKVLDNLVISAVTAFCWLYWKFRTEYVDMGALDE